MDPSKLFAVYTKRQEKCQSFKADEKELIMEVTMINTCLTHIIATGLMTTTYHEWKWLDGRDKMWSKFKEHFNDAVNKL